MCMRSYCLTAACGPWAVCCTFKLLNPTGALAAHLHQVQAPDVFNVKQSLALVLQTLMIPAPAVSPAQGDGHSH